MGKGLRYFAAGTLCTVMIGWFGFCAHFFDKKIAAEETLSSMIDEIAQTNAPQTDYVGAANDENPDDAFSQFGCPIASYTTSFASSGEGRRANVILAASCFRGRIVASGERLSFNETVGPRTIERGYQTANVIFAGEYVEGIGGGVCQVSSTLYNAWIRAGLGVESVRAHSLPASYCAMSQDATVSEFIDLTLRNDGDDDIVVDAVVNGSDLTFTLYGAPRKWKIKVETQVIDVLPPQTCEVAYADTLSGYSIIQEDGAGQYAVARQEHNGYRTCAIAKYYSDGRMVGQKVIRKDTYLSVRGKIVRLKHEG